MIKNNPSNSLVIGWLYPKLMSTYGDRGNITVLSKRCEWRDINTKILHINPESTDRALSECDIVIGGGAQDRQQEIAIADLLKKKITLQKMFEKGIPGLFVCGSPQLLGHFYTTGVGKKLPGLGIFDMETKHFGKNKPRCIGNLVAIVDEKYYQHYESLGTKPNAMRYIVGFENHGGRSFLGTNTKPFAKIVIGNGNNGQDSSEGAVFQNCIATYSHGPFLPKNPQIADWLVKTALEVKYGKEIQLKPLDDTIELKAHDFMLKRLGVKI